MPLESLHHILVSDLLDVIRLCGLIAHTLHEMGDCAVLLILLLMFNFYLFGII